jgi:hypothetical protein
MIRDIDMKHRLAFSKESHFKNTRVGKSAAGQYLFGEPKYTPGEVNFKDANKDTWRYKHYESYHLVCSWSHS